MSSNVTFASVGNLDRHLRSRAFQVIYVCPQGQGCIKSFTRKDKFVDHLVKGHKYSKDDARSWLGISAWYPPPLPPLAMDMAMAVDTDLAPATTMAGFEDEILDYSGGL